MSGTDETLPSNPDFRIGNNLDHMTKHFSFILAGDGTGTFIGYVASSPMTWTLSGSTININYHLKNYELSVTSKTNSELVATHRGNINT